MNDLIKITQVQIGAENINSVNIKDLVEAVGVLTHPSQWFQRQVSKYGFIKNEDYLILKSEKQTSSGTKHILDYIVTVDTAKELAMLVNNDQGRKVRKYFIKVEKQSQKVLTTSEQISLIAQGHQEIDSRLTTLEQTKKLEYWQEKALQDAKNKKVYEIAKDDKVLAKKLHRKVWSLFKKQFHLPRYNELPAVKFEDGLVFIRNLTITDMV